MVQATPATTDPAHAATLASTLDPCTNSKLKLRKTPDLPESSSRPVEPELSPFDSKPTRTVDKALLMFTGLIEEVGTVAAARRSDDCTQLQIAAPLLAKQIKIGDSIAVNGCCLTVAARRAHNLTFDLLAETIARTNLKGLEPEDRVNLERALSAEARRGGHFVQGHIDCVAPIVLFQKTGSDFRLEIELPAEFAQYVIRKGSIALNGISLTVADVLTSTFAVWIIPYTKRHTNLQHAKTGDLVNIEFDILAKYVERMLQRTPPSSKKAVTDGSPNAHNR